MSEVIRILGVDPGSTATGWAIVESARSVLRYVASGAIRPQRTLAHARKLAVIFSELSDIIERHQPNGAAVEATFVNASPRDALILGQARGVALLAPAHAGLSVAEYAANVVKKAVVGKGHADKQQVQAMVRVLLPKCGEPGSDEADALAVAICHIHHSSLAQYSRAS